jgi:hypothetical protein
VYGETTTTQGAQTAMANLSSLERNELSQVKNSRAIRVAIYDAAILIGAFLLAHEISKAWPEYADVARVIAAGTWVGAIIQRYTDWKSLKFIEGALDGDE